MEDVSTRKARSRPLRWAAVVALVVAVCVGVRFACAPTPEPALRRVDAPVVTEKPRRAANAEVPAAQVAPPPSTPSVESPKTRTVRILVVADADGAPIAEAQVHVDETRRHRVEKPDGSTDYEETVVRTIDAKSGADGVVVGSVSGYEAALVVKKSGFLVVRRRIEGDAEEIRVPLVASIVVRGRVVFAETHEPAPGVAVRAWDTGKMQGFTQDAVLDDVVTGPDGRFELAGVPSGRQFRVAATKVGWRSTDAVLTLTEAVPEIELVLGDGGVMFGVVYGADGAPLADVDVFQIRPDMDELPHVRGDGPFMSYARDDFMTFVFPPFRTDAAGRYEFKGVRLPVDGVSQPRQAAARLANGRSARSEPATFTRQGERQQRDVRFTKSSSITVTVKSKTPLPERAEIRCQGNPPNSSNATRPVPIDGSPVVFDDLPANTYFVGVSRDLGDFIHQRWTLTRTVKLAEGESAFVELTVDGALRIEGRVVDSDGHGIGEIGVDYSAFARDENMSVSTGDVTSVDGGFELEGLLSIGGELRIGPSLFAMIGYMGQSRTLPGVESVEMHDVRPGGPPMTITLRRLGRLVGHVKPVPKNRHGSVLARAATRNGSAQFEVAEDGRFECSAPLVGEASVACFDFQTKPLTVIDLPAIASGETKDVGEIALETGVAFEGKLVDADGHGIAAAHLHALCDWAWFDDTSTDVAGRFRLDAMSKHTFLIQVRATHATPMTVLRVDPTASPTTFVVGPGALVSGHVLDAAGKPVAGAHVSVVPIGIADDAADAYDSMEAEADGSYVIRVQAGRAKLSAWAGSVATLSESIEVSVADGEKRALDLRLR